MGQALPPTGSVAPVPLVTLRGVTKAFPGVLANDHVDLDVYGGEVHALLGENGAGKSTLVKVLYGFHRPDAGQILLNGNAVQIRSPHDGRGFGIGLVFQDFTLVPAMSVVENVALFLPDLPTRLDYAAIARRIAEMTERYGLAIDPWRLVGTLSIGQQQKVEILKLLLADARILALDEPTRVLAPHEVDGLVQVMRRLRDDGYGVILITHKLRDVLMAADRITVMRRGRVAGTLRREDATEAGLLTLMFGTVPRKTATRPGAAEVGAPVLEVSDVATSGPGVRLEGISFAVHSGEIVGVAGVSGNGQRELGDVILGVLSCARGSKRLDGEDATAWSVARMRQHGVAFIPEEPLRMGVVATLSVQENMTLGALRRYQRLGGLAMDWRTAAEDLDAALKRLALEPLPPHARAGTLSGGNVQRLSLARELFPDPRLIVALYPTRGLDVASAVAARDLLSSARARGAGVLLISEDLDELFELADRLFVLYEGRIVGVLRPQDTTTAAVGRLMTGREATYG